MPDVDPIKKEDPAPAPAPDLAKENAELKAKIAAFEAKKKSDDEDLTDKARKQKEQDDKKVTDEKDLEKAIRFNMQSAEFLKTNEALLPAEVSEIFKQADKEKYENQIEKDRAIKAGIIQSFFGVQENINLLTTGQKAELDNYLKLTKNEKQNKAQAVYDMVFEPAFEALRKQKKADALHRGHVSGDDDSYKKRLMAGSRKHYLGEKNVT